MRPVHVFVPIWGTEFTHAFLNLSLPYLLTARNLSELRSPGAWRFRIYTSLEDGPVLLADPSIVTLQTFIPVDIFTIGARDELLRDSGSYQNAAYRLELSEAAKANAGVFFMSPDTVGARGSLAFAEEIWAAGFRCLLGASARALTEPFQAALLAENAWPAAPGNGVSSAVLARLTIENMHPWTADLTLDRIPRAVARETAGIYAQLGAQALGGLSWMWHPWLLDPHCVAPNFGRYLKESIDMAIPFVTTLSKEEMYYACDSDRFLFTEYSTPAKVIPLTDAPASELLVPDDAELAGYLANFFCEFIQDARPRADLAIENFKHLAVIRAGPIADLRSDVIARLDGLRERTLELVRRRLPA